jgi:hypothetical protein
VTVPKRYFSKDDGNHYFPRRLDNKAADGRDPRSILPAQSQDEEIIATGLETQAKESMYTSQDVRSSLHKTTNREPDPPITDSIKTSDAHKAQTDRTSLLKITDRKPYGSNKEEFVDNDGALTVEVPLSIQVGSGEPEKATNPSPTVPALMTEQPMSGTTKTAEAIPPIESAPNEISASLTITHAMPNDEDATAEKPLEPQQQLEETPKFGHRRVESCKKADFTVDTIEPSTPVVKIPVSVISSVPPVQHTSAENETAEPEGSVETEIKLQSREESPSDNDQELSFQSAPEVAEVESTLVPPVEPILANQEKEDSPVSLSEKAAIKSPLAKVAELREISSESPIPDSAATKREVVTPATGPSTTTASVTEDAQDSASSGGSITQMDVNSVTASSAPTKKSGPQQTPSVNPFAVQKALERKEKEEKRKEKKRKVQEEQAAKAKAKADKATSTASKKSAVLTSEDQEHQVLSATTSRSDVDAQTSTLTSQQAASQTANSKGKGRRHVLSPMDAAVESASSTQTTGVFIDLTKEHPPSEDEVAKRDAVAAPNSRQDEKVEGQIGHSGKQTGGLATKISNQTGSVTEKAKVNQTAIAGRTQDSTIESAHTFLVQSRKRDGKREAADNAPVASTTVATYPKKSNDVMAQNKDKKPVPAVPILNLQSLRKKNDLPSSATAPGASSSSGASAQGNSLVSSWLDQKLTGTAALPQSAPELDAASFTSHDTTLLNENAALTSPSPTAEDFHTPMQTPASTEPQPQALATKKKKRKNNSKKKAAAITEPTEATTVSAASSSAPPANTAGDNDSRVRNLIMAGFHSTGSASVRNPLDYDNDPFGNQITHIDAVRHEHNNPSPNNYYADVNRRIAERKAAEEKAIAEGKPIPGQAEKDLWAKLQAFANETDGKSS